MFDLALFLDLALFSYRNVLILRIVISLLQAFAGFQPPPGLRPAMSFLYDVTEPFLRLFRGLLPAVGAGGMGLDLSPILAFIVIEIARGIVRALLF